VVNHLATGGHVDDISKPTGQGRLDQLAGAAWEEVQSIAKIKWDKRRRTVGKLIMIPKLYEEAMETRRELKNLTVTIDLATTVAAVGSRKGVSWEVGGEEGTTVLAMVPS